jgi:hypothetical protein
MKTERLEGVVQVLILIGIAGMAGAASFTHVHDWTMRNAPHGTGSWFGWANAIISELTPAAAGIEIRRRKRHHHSVAYPMGILIAAALLSLSAQVAEARPTLGGWISAAVPALAFLALTKLILSRPGGTKEDQSCAMTAAQETAPGQAAVTAPVPATTTTPSPASAASPDPAPVSAVSTPVADTLRDLRPVPSGQLLIAARMAAFAHQQATGQPITPGQLAERQDIPLALAESLLDHLDGTTPPPVTAANGTVINGSRP